MDNQIKIEDWEKRFDEKFDNINKTLVTIETLDGFNEQRPAALDIKSFISTLLKSQRDSRDKELRDKVEQYSKQENYWDEMPDVNDFQKGALHSRNKMTDFVLSLLKEDIKN